MRCFDWSPEYTPNDTSLLAVGYATGRTSLFKFSYGEKDTMHAGVQAITDLLPRHARACNVISFSPGSSRMLLSGLDKVRNDYSLLVYNLNSTVSSTMFNQTRDVVNEARPPIAFQSGFSEVVSSAAWFPDEGISVVSGMGLKWIRIFDLRKDTSSTSSTVIATKSVYGLAIDPFNPIFFASYYDNVVSIWDKRKTAEPVLSLDCAFRYGVNDLSWCPAKPGLLCAIGREAASIQLFNVRYGIQQSNEIGVNENGIRNENDAHDHNTPILWQSKNVDVPFNTVVACDWAPTSISSNKFSVLVCSSKDNLGFIEFNISLSLSYGFMDDLSVARDGDVASFEPPDTICPVIYNRALKGYLFDPEKNQDIVKDELDLAMFWEYMRYLSPCVDEGRCKFDNVDYALLGIDGIVTGLRNSKVKSKRILCGPSGLLSFYQHSFRQIGLRTLGILLEDIPSSMLCSDERGSLEALISRYIQLDQHETAAGFAFFFEGNIQKAVQILLESKSDNLKLAGVAIAGYNGMESNPSLLNVLKDLTGAIDNPFIVAIFTLLLTRNWSTVVQTKGLSLRETTAIALRFFDDDLLEDFVSVATEDLVQTGIIQGLLMTGFTERGLRLLSEYVDRTADVQTAALLPTKFFKSDYICDAWVQEYREILDRLQLYEARAKYDIERNSGFRDNKFGLYCPPPVLIRCNFCGHSVSLSFSKRSTLKPGSGSSSGCPQCRKPLPRCSLCLGSMGTLPDSSNSSEITAEASPFDRWFTWCQQCRHGGHASHLTQWFEKNKSCPVVGCSCTCLIN
ncbi:WD40-repeat-containing domain protein [Chytridium lagenaria]|nr:WD40-repeat-containing domain protein [Chytridium lagenaria]